MRLSEHFHLDEFLRSQTAARRDIDMTPSEDVVQALQSLCVNTLEPIRRQIGRPVVISSGYRPPALNEAIGGATNSQHQYGQAADILVPGITVRKVWSFVRHSNIPFDQLIEEFNQWTHVSYHSPTRGDVLVATHVDGHAHYARV